MRLHCTMVNACEQIGLVRNEWHYLMDKKNDHSCKHSQRDNFIDTRAASHCYAFHSFPHPDDSSSRHMQSSCTASVNEMLRAAAAVVGSACEFVADAVAASLLASMHALTRPRPWIRFGWWRYPPLAAQRKATLESSAQAWALPPLDTRGLS